MCFVIELKFLKIIHKLIVVLFAKLIIKILLHILFSLSEYPKTAITFIGPLAFEIALFSFGTIGLEQSSIESECRIEAVCDLNILNDSSGN